MTKKNTKQKVMSLLLTGVVASSFISMGETLLNGEPVEVSQDLADNFTSVSTFSTVADYDSIFKTLNVSTEKITQKKLKEVTEIEIHANEFDFDDLDLMPNLSTITIDNANCLTEEEKEQIANSSIENIILNYNFKDFTVNSKLDINAFKNKHVYLNCPLKGEREEIESLVFYNVYSNLSEEEKSFVKVLNYSEEDMNKLASWNNKINNIINSFNFTSQTSDEDKLITIVNYVTDTYTYDSYIDINLENGTNTATVDKLADEYYANMISGLLDNDNTNATCANYAGLTSVLSQYVGLDVELDIGSYGDTGHAWNTYNDNGREVIIDATAIDDYDRYNYYKSLYENTNIDPYTKDLLAESIYITEEYEPEMINNYKVNKIYYDDKDYIKDVNYVNSNPSELVKRKLALEGIVSTVAALALAAGIKIEKNKKYVRPKQMVTNKKYYTDNNNYEIKNYYQNQYNFNDVNNYKNDDFIINNSLDIYEAYNRENNYQRK